MHFSEKHFAAGGFLLGGIAIEIAVPLVYALLKDKTEVSYTAVLQAKTSLEKKYNASERHVRLSVSTEKCSGTGIP